MKCMSKTTGICWCIYRYAMLKYSGQCIVDIYTYIYHIKYQLVSHGAIKSSELSHAPPKFPWDFLRATFCYINLQLPPYLEDSWEMEFDLSLRNKGPYLRDYQPASSPLGLVKTGHFLPTVVENWGNIPNKKRIKIKHTWKTQMDHKQIT